MPLRLMSRLENGSVALALHGGVRGEGTHAAFTFSPWNVDLISVDHPEVSASQETSTTHVVELSIDFQQGYSWKTSAPWGDVYFMISLWANAFLTARDAMHRQRDELMLEVRNRVWFSAALRRDGHRADLLFPIASPTSMVVPEDAMSGSVLTREELERAYGQLGRRREEYARGGQECEVARNEPPQPADRAGRAFRDLLWSQPVIPRPNTGNLGHMLGGVATGSDEGLVSQLEIGIDEARTAQDETVVQVVSVAEKTRLDRRDTTAVWEQDGQEVTRRTRRAS